MTINYIARDDDANVTPRTPDNVIGVFTLQVQDVPETPEAPAVTATPDTSESLDVKWDAPADNNSPILYYVVEYREEGGSWVVVPDNVTETMVTIDTGLTNGTMYEVHVQAVNGIGRSGWSEVGSGIPSLSEGLPDVPEAPTVNPTADTPGSLDVTWVAPADNGSAIHDYHLRYKMTSSANWTVMTAAIIGTSTTLSGMPAGTSYDVQVRAWNSNGASDWSPTGTGSTAAAPAALDLKGQITSMKLTGGVTKKNIGGVTRSHVTEGATDVKLEVTVQWTHAEISALYGAGTTALPAEINVQIKGWRVSHQQSVSLPSGNWVSWIDDGQDAHFPDAGPFFDGHSTGRVTVKIPAKPKTTELPYSEREVRSSTASISLLLLADDHEAENDAFYVDAVWSTDVDLGAGSAVNRTTGLVIIEDDDVQGVAVTHGTPASLGPTTVYENADTPFTIKAVPARNQLPLDVRLDMLDLSGVTVSAAKISLSTAAVTLNTDRSGTPASNSASVTVHLPPSDGDRKDDEYDLRASVNVYSLAAGGYEAIEAALHRVNVLDIHKLPWLSVSPSDATVMEGKEMELTLTVNRNPSNTIAVDPETRQYTSEALSIAVMRTPSGGNHTVPTTVAVPAHNKKSPWTQMVTVTFEAGEDEDVDPDMALTLDFVVNGTVAANGPRPDGDTDSVAQAVLTIQDATTTLVSVRDNAYDVIQAELGTPPTLMTGMSGELMGANLFDYVETAVSVVYATSVESGAVTASASGGTVTITAGVSAGEAKVSITATATLNGSTLIPDQTKSNVAKLTFPVMVEDVPLEVMLSTDPMDGMVEEGGMVKVIATATSRVVGENVEVMLMRDAASTASMEDYEFSVPLITIMSGDMTGELTLTAKDDNDVEGMEKLTLVGMVGDVMVGSVTIEIADNDMDITYTLSGPENMNLVEGMDHANGTKTAAMLTVTASSAVVTDTEVMIMRDGASTASADDYGPVESVMIMAGEMTGTTEVMAVEDDMAEDMEMLILYGMVDGMNTTSVSFYLWDHAVPALPVIAQLLLAAFLAIGGFRRYRRR